MREFLGKIKNKLENDKFIINCILVYLIIRYLDISVMIQSNAYIGIAQVLRYSIYIVLILRICIRFKYKDITAFQVIGVILITFIFGATHLTSIIIWGIIAFALKDIALDDVIMKSFWGLSITNCVLISGACIGMIPDWTYGRDEFIVRHSLGYMYATFPNTIYFLILLMRLYIKQGEISVNEIISHIMIASLLYKLTDSRTGFILSLVIIVIMIMLKILRENQREIKIGGTSKKVIKIVSSVIPSAVVVFSLLTSLGFYYTNAFCLKLDSYLSGRLYYSVEAFKSYGVTWFGQNIDWHGWGGYSYIEQENFVYNYVDNAYLQLMFDYGVLFLVFFIVCYSVCLYQLAKKEEYLLSFCMILLLVWGIVEPGVASLDKNIFLILIFGVLNMGKIKR